MAAGDHAEEGMLVELHSLSRADLNGEQGLCGAWDATKERFAVTLASGTLAVKPANLRRAPPVPEAAAAEATELAHEAARLLSQARGGTNSTLQCGAAPRLSGEAPALIAEAEQKLAEAARLDAASTTLHLTWCDLANMRSDRAAAVLHARRAVANTPATKEGATKELRQHAHMALATACGNAGDVSGEVAQLKLVLRIEPENLHARLVLGQALMAAGRDEDAVPELMMVVQLRAEEGPHSGEQAAALRRMAAHTLKVIHMKAVQRHDAAFQNEEMLARLRKAEEAATRAVELTEGMRVERVGGHERGLIRPFALCSLGNVKERMGDEAGQDLALYAEAEQLYLAAHLAGSQDAATAECYTRVQAKRSKDIAFTLLPARIGVDVVMSGQARALAKWSPKPLPPSTTT